MKRPNGRKLPNQSSATRGGTTIDLTTHHDRNTFKVLTRPKVYIFVRTIFITAAGHVIVGGNISKTGDGQTASIVLSKGN